MGATLATACIVLLYLPTNMMARHDVLGDAHARGPVTGPTPATLPALPNVQPVPRPSHFRLRLADADQGAHNKVTILTQAVSAENGMVQIRSRDFMPAIGLDEDTIVSVCGLGQLSKRDGTVGERGADK